MTEKDMKAAEVSVMVHLVHHTAITHHRTEEGTVAHLEDAEEIGAVIEEVPMTVAGDDDVHVVVVQNAAGTHRDLVIERLLPG